MKRWLAAVLSLALLLTTVPHIIFAADVPSAGDEVGTQGFADLYFEYVGLDTVATQMANGGASANVSGPHKVEQKALEDLQVNDVIWLALRVENMTKWPGAKFGIASFQAPVYYDARYVEPYVSKRIGENTFGGLLKKHHIATGTGDNAGTTAVQPWHDYTGMLSDSIYDTFNANTAASINNTSAEPLILADDAEVKVALYGVKATATYQEVGMDVALRFNEANMKEDGTGTSYVDDKVDLLYYPFKIKEKPAAGTKVVQLRLNGEQFTVEVGPLVGAGVTKNDYTGSWIADKTVADTHNLKDYFYFHGNPNLFPATEQKYAVDTNVKTLDKDGIESSTLTGGTISQSGKGQYEEGADVTVTATANKGYKFQKWTDGTNDVSTDNPYSFKMPAAAKTLTAVFQQKEDLQCPGTATYNKSSDSDLTITVDPKADYTSFVSAAFGSTRVDNDPNKGSFASNVITLKASYLRSLTAGDYTLTIKYKDPKDNEEATATCKLTVVEDRDDDVTGITWSAAPKTSYVHGDAINLNGLKFTADFVVSGKLTFEFANGAWKTGTGFGGDPATKGITVGLAENAAGTATAIANGAKLSRATHNNQIFVVSKGSVSANSGTSKLTVGQKSITAKLTVTGSDVYNGTTALKAGTTVTPSLTGVVSGETVSLTTTLDNIEMTNKIVGNSKALQFKSGHTPALSGTDAGNYTLSGAVTLESKYNVTKKDIQITTAKLPVSDIFAGGNTVVNMENQAVTFDDLVSGDTVTVSYKATYPSTGNGTVTVTISNVTLTGTDAGNYNLVNAPTTSDGNISSVTITKIEVTGQPTNPSAVYGDAFNLDGLAVKITYSDNSTTTHALSNNGWDKAVPGSVKIQINGTDVVPGTTPAAWEMKGKDITVTDGTHTGTATKKAEVTPRTINVTVKATGSKVYDGGLDFNGKGNLAAVAEGGILDADKAAVTLAVDASKVKFADKNAGGNKAIAVENGAVTINGDTDGKYTVGTVDTASEASITAKTIKVTDITNVPSVMKDSEGADSASATQSALTFEAEKELVAGDGIKLTYDYAYTSTAEAGEVDVAITNLAIADDSDNKDNYTLENTTLTAKGTVSSKLIDSITVKTQPKLDYKYGDTLDLTALVISAVSGTESTDVAYADGAGFTFEVDGKQIANGDKLTADMNGKTIKVFYESKEAFTDKLTVEKIQLTASATVAEDKSLTKVYDGTAVLPEGTTVEDFTITLEGVLEGEDVTVTAKSAAYNDKTANDTKTIVFELELAGADAANYILPTEVTGITDAKISKKDIKVSDVPKVRAITQGGNATVNVSNASSFTTDPADAIIKGDEVLVNYTAKYDDPDTASSNASVTISNMKLSGKDAENYNLTDYTKTATGTVNARASRPTGGGSSGGNGNRYTYDSSQLTITPDNITGQIGSSQQLEATFNVTVTNKDLKWSSSDTGVAVVNEYGKVTLVGTGSAVITAVAVANEEIYDSINVKVIPSATLMDKETVVPYIVGYRDGTFGPENAITREEVATIFTRLLSNKMDPDGSYSTSFNDVAADRWSKDAIGYLESFNILQGYPDGSYRPANSITRAEMAVIITRAERADLSIATGKTGFNDITNDLYWAETSIKYLADQGVLTGYPDGSFAPNKPITRAETVTIINRLLKNMTVEEITRTPSDVANDYWAYDDIVKAMNDRKMQ